MPAQTNVLLRPNDRLLGALESEQIAQYRMVVGSCLESVGSDRMQMRH